MLIHFVETLSSMFCRDLSTRSAAIEVNTVDGFQVC